MSVLDNYPIRREITEGIHWLGGCGERIEPNGEVLHSAASTYLVVGADKALMFDTGAPMHWHQISQALDEILGDRPVDFVVPSHTELPHSGNLPKFFERFPAIRAIGDVRDYHLFYPKFEDRLEPWPLHQPIDLGGGFSFSILEAPIKDLTNSVWGYESRQQVMFVADAFGYLHRETDHEEPVHFPGECRLLTHELTVLPEVYQAAYLTRGALSWTGYMDASQFLGTVDEMLERFPSRLIAPTHGNVISNLEQILPIMREAYTSVYQSATAAR